MALLTILCFPDPRLKNVADKITIFDDTLQRLIDDMFETMYHAPGVGLAATQVGIKKRLAVIDVSSEKNQPLVLINPEIIELDEYKDLEEGCLSVPDYYDTISRANKIKMRALNAQGKEYTLEAQGLLAQCIQHEIDHLNGKLYIDYLSSLKRKLIRNKMKKLQRQQD
jgi:peptide deformylase